MLKFLKRSKNMNKFIKKAFSTVEILIVIGVIGIIIVLSFTMVRPFDRTTIYQYYNAYNTLKNAAYNINADALDAVKSTENTITDFDKRFALNSTELCKKLAVDRNNPDSKYGYINTVEYNCEDDTPSFKASSTMIYTISDMITYKQKDSLKNSESNRNGFIVLVDLNGEKKPNTSQWKKGRAVDIVPFLVTSAGQVLPLGSPTVDKRYMTASAKITENSKQLFTKTVTYREAQIMAFGDKEYPSVDTTSIRDSLTGNVDLPQIDSSIELPAAQQDARCVVDDGFVPPCTVEVDEYTRNL